MNPEQRREERVSCRRERRATETAEERETRLFKRRARGRARRASQTAIIQRKRDLQQGREQVLRETVEERETRLQRLRLVSETQEERETRLQRMGQRTVSRRLGRTERPAFDECSRGWHLRLLRTERPAFNKCVSTSRRGWHLRPLRTETRLQQMCINKHQRLASETTFLQGLTQVKEMLISAVMPIICITVYPMGSTATVVMLSTCIKMFCPLHLL